MLNINDQIVGTRYCLQHGRYCTAAQDEEGGIYHYEVTMEDTVSGEQCLGYEMCYGPFVYVAPPEPLTETEWEEIISQEIV